LLRLIKAKPDLPRLLLYIVVLAVGNVMKPDQHIECIFIIPKTFNA